MGSMPCTEIVPSTRALSKLAGPIGVQRRMNGKGVLLRRTCVWFIMVIKMGFVHGPTLMFYRRLLKTMMKTFVGDYNMFHQTRLEARRKIK